MEKNKASWLIAKKIGDQLVLTCSACGKRIEMSCAAVASGREFPPAVCPECGAQMEKVV